MERGRTGAAPERLLIPALHGNLLGLSPAEKHRLERLYRRRIPPRSILTHELAREMAAISHALQPARGAARRSRRPGRGGRRRRGARPDRAAPAQRARRGGMRFCTLRFLATKFEDDEPLRPADLAPLALHRLDAMAIIAVDEQTACPGPVRVAHLLPAPERTDAGTARLARRKRTDGEHARLPRGAVRAPPARRDVDANGRSRGRRRRRRALPAVAAAAGPPRSTTTSSS